jgi:hypothetical protein
MEKPKSDAKDTERRLFITQPMLAGGVIQVFSAT